MRRLLTSAVLVSLVTVGVVLFAPSPAYADPVCQVNDPQTGQCLIWVEAAVDPEPTTPNNPVEATDTGPGQPCVWDPSKQGLSQPPGPVPCTSKHGYWSNAHNCYIALADPQPPRGAAFWEGAYLAYGAVYQCSNPRADFLSLIWLVDAPPGSGTGPTPQEVAEQAIDQMNLAAIDIGIAPEPGPDSIGVVGMPVWMWVADPDNQTYGPTTATASAGGLTITATGRVHQITWDMGDGTTVTCRTAGTPYDAGYGRTQSPDCGHVYSRSSSREEGGRYVVTATSDWVVTWEGAGQSGTIRLDGLQRSVEIAIGEGQVLVR